VSTSAERPVLSHDFAGSVAYAGVDPALEGRALQDALRAATATRGGSCWWDVEHAGGVVTLLSPGRSRPSAAARRRAAWRLLWLMVPERAIGSFRTLTQYAAGCSPEAREP
jgi:hypothetical protein